MEEQVKEKWKIREGWRRLSLVLGIIGLSIWATGSSLYLYSHRSELVLVELNGVDFSKDLEEIRKEKVDLYKMALQNEQAEKQNEATRQKQKTVAVTIILTGILSFGLPFGCVRGAAWTVDGFR